MKISLLICSLFAFSHLVAMEGLGQEQAAGPEQEQAPKKNVIKVTEVKIPEEILKEDCYEQLEDCMNCMPSLFGFTSTAALALNNMNKHAVWQGTRVTIDTNVFKQDLTCPEKLVAAAIVVGTITLSIGADKLRQRNKRVKMERWQEHAPKVWKALEDAKKTQ